MTSLSVKRLSRKVQRRCQEFVFDICIRTLRLYSRFALIDEPKDFSTFHKFTSAFYPRYKLKWPYLDWWEDTKFIDSIERFDGANGLNADRRFMLKELAKLVEGVPGDTAECGAYMGCGSYIICAATKQSGIKRTHHIFDSFEGLSQPQAVDGDHWKSNDMSISLAQVKKNLGDFPEIKYHIGWIPDKFVDVNDIKFAFIHVDVDLYEPTKESLEFFYQRMPPGAVLVCDDFGSSLCPGSTRAVIEFLDRKPEKMIALSAGGGFFIRGSQST